MSYPVKDAKTTSSRCEYHTNTMGRLAYSQSNPSFPRRRMEYPGDTAYDTPEKGMFSFNTKASHEPILTGGPQTVTRCGVVDRLPADDTAGG